MYRRTGKTIVIPSGRGNCSGIGDGNVRGEETEKASRGVGRTTGGDECRGGSRRKLKVFRKWERRDMGCLSQLHGGGGIGKREANEDA